jgi:hypothetical protein
VPDSAAAGPTQEALLDEKRKLEEAIATELKGKGAAPAAPAPQEQPAPDQAGASGSGSGGAAPAAAEGGGGEEEEGGEGVDALDAFMSNVESQIEQDKARALRPVLTSSSTNFALKRQSRGAPVWHVLLMPLASCC